MSEDNIVKFAKLRSAPDVSFWAKFAELKLDKFKLEDRIRIPIWGSYSFDSDEQYGKPLALDYTSFNDDLETTSHKSNVACHGLMINTNTFEAFKQTNPQELINNLGQELTNCIYDGTALKNPWKLLAFVLFAYSDLKKYKFHYWFAHPTPFNLPEMNFVKPETYISEEFSESQIDTLKSEFFKLSSKEKTFFCVIVFKESKILEVVSLARGVEICHSSDKEGEADIYFAFYDPCNHTAPGWPLRNLLCLLFYECSNACIEKWIKFISVRGPTFNKSIIYTITTKEKKSVLLPELFSENFVGWENNLKGKLGPKIADLSESMDPVKLSEKAITLNLKLMKWRLVPELDLDYIGSLRCLLLGAGTLGCTVARVLLGWGVQNLTLVDNSVVSFSNTVRQNLYTHEDAVNQRYKAEAAIDSLLKIHPRLNVNGVVLQIPMPGHVIGESMLEATKADFIKLEELFKIHDVVFLLLDSREARWLPTVMCAAYNKLAINAALGFDSYTVQRHGSRNCESPTSPDLTLQNPTGKDLGCYFCNDVTQPGNSQVDRTLDQQCTVSRPGLSFIAGGLAVELMVAVTQHPEKIEVTALMDESKEQFQNRENASIGLLGGVPHTIRGSLWSYNTRLTITHRFQSCTACSQPIINEFKKRKEEFVLNACNQPNYLEKLSGLEDLLKRPDLDELCCAIDTSDEEDDG